MNTTTRRITLLAVGTALFVALSMCLQVPVFENYYLCLGYVVMAVYCYSFGTVSGVVFSGSAKDTTDSREAATEAARREAMIF